MSTWHYDETPMPVGNPVNMNGRDTAYSLGMYDGANYGDQYPDEPEQDVLFESPAAAKKWLDGVAAVLQPYIETGDRTSRAPDLTGWSSDE